MPFVHFLGLFVQFVAGIALLVEGWRRRSRWLKVSGGIVLALLVILIGRELILEGAMEWNPALFDEELLGTWRDRDEILTLAADHTFSYHRSEENLTGRWNRDDWNLELQSENAAWTARLVRYFHHLRIMTHPPDDLDAWDGNPGLKKR
ncbi:MAG: hypothetical protein WDN28_02980 [Chthoniobacter sp.]